MKKNILFFAVLFILAINVAFAEEMGVVINDKLIKPGDPVFYLVSQASFPDGIKAVRGKDKEHDFVVFIYKSYNLRVDINNETNLIQGILLQSNDLEIKGIPFKVGSSFNNVLSSWGKPDANYDDEACYWEKGIYLKVNPSGNIEHIYIAEPNTKVDAEPSNV